MSFVFNRLFYRLHACQHGLSRACKRSFFRLMLEFLDKLIIVRNLRLLALVGFALYLQIFKLLLPVLRVVAGISVQCSVFKLVYTSRNRIQKRPIMRHHDNSLGIVYQIILQPLDSFHIQMVGRLVKKQQIRLFKQQLYQGNLRLFSS